jgi:hypothetical protein
VPRTQYSRRSCGNPLAGPDAAEELEEDLSWIQNVLDGEDPAEITDNGSSARTVPPGRPVLADADPSEEGAVDSLVAVIQDITAAGRRSG